MVSARSQHKLADVGVLGRNNANSASIMYFSARSIVPKLASYPGLRGEGKEGGAHCLHCSYPVLQHLLIYAESEHSPCCPLHLLRGHCDKGGFGLGIWGWDCGSWMGRGERRRIKWLSVAVAARPRSLALTCLMLLAISRFM